MAKKEDAPTENGYVVLGFTGGAEVYRSKPFRSYRGACAVAAEIERAEGLATEVKFVGKHGGPGTGKPPADRIF